MRLPPPAGHQCRSPAGQDNARGAGSSGVAGKWDSTSGRGRRPTRARRRGTRWRRARRVDRPGRGQLSLVGPELDRGRPDDGIRLDVRHAVFAESELDGGGADELVDRRRRRGSAHRHGTRRRPGRRSDRSASLRRCGSRPWNEGVGHEQCDHDDRADTGCEASRADPGAASWCRPGWRVRCSVPDPSRPPCRPPVVQVRVSDPFGGRF